MEKYDWFCMSFENYEEEKCHNCKNEIWDTGLSIKLNPGDRIFKFCLDCVALSLNMEKNKPQKKPP